MVLENIDSESGVQFDSDLITFIDHPESRNQVLWQMTELLYQKGKIHDQEQFYQAILKRESIVSTGIGLGVAIPHAKIAGFDQFFVAVGILSKKGVDWDAIDQLPVRVVFLIGGPAEKQNEYLHILSAITQRIRDEGVRSRLFLSHSPQAVIEQLS